MDEVLAGRRILLIEDEMMIAIMIEGMLTDVGHMTVTRAANNDQALRMIETREFDVAMLDLNLDGQRSYPLADRLAGEGIPFVFSTGYGDHGSTEGYSDRPVLRKPFRYEELARVLGHLLSA